MNEGVINQYITFHSYISRYSRGDISFDNMYFLKNAYRTINGNFAKIKRKKERIYIQSNVNYEKFYYIIFLYCIGKFGL